MELQTYEFEFTADSLREGAELIFNRPHPVRAPVGAKDRLTKDPYSRKYIEPDLNKYEGVAHYRVGDRNTLEATIAAGETASPRM